MGPGDAILWDGSRTLVMGILNVTPDSFSDGGDFWDPDAAISHGLALWAEGADIVDVGGESTRPGAEAIDATEECRRVVGVIAALTHAGVTVSLDTTKAQVAAAGLEAGAAMINDVSAFADPDMAAVVAQADAAAVLMHRQGTPRTMQENPTYDDVVAEVRRFLEERAAGAAAAGMKSARIAIDPGIGFGKTLDHNLALLGHLHELVGTGYPVVVGTSRKSFLGALLGIEAARDRDNATGATTALAIAQGVACVRVHSVAVSTQIARVVDAIVHCDEEAT